MKTSERISGWIPILSAALSALSVLLVRDKALFALAVLIAAAASAVTAWPRGRSAASPGRADGLFAGLLYASFFSFVAVTARVGLGYMESDPLSGLASSQMPAELLSGGTSQSVYYKGDLRSLVKAFFLIFFSSAIMAQAVFRRARQAPGSRPPDAALPATLILLFVCFAILPPMRLDPTHWGSWIGPASGIGQWRWPYVHTHAQYGLMPALLTWAWVQAFGLSQLSLITLVWATSLAAGLALYLLTRRLTGSGAAALLTAATMSFFYVSRDAYALFPNMGPIRAQLPTMLGLLLLHLSFDVKGRPLLWSLLYGLMALWEPVLGFLLLASFMLCHGIRLLAGHKAAAGKMALCAAAVLVPLGLMAVGRLPDGGPVLLKRIFRHYDVFSQGFAALPQVFPSEALLAFVFLLLALWKLGKSLARHGLRLTDRDLLLLSTLIVSPMWVMYAMGRSVEPYFFPLLWTVAPGLAMLSYTMIRAMRKRALAAGLIMLVLLTGGAVKSSVFASFQGFMTRYEPDRFAWHTECGDSIYRGGNCDPETLPGLRAAIVEASAAMLGGEAGGTFEMTVDDRGSLEARPFEISHPEAPLIEACKAGVPLVSGLDSFIYMQHGCLPRHRFLSLSIVAASGDMDELADELLKHDSIAYDNRLIPHGLERVQEGIRRRLEARGAREYARCGEISLLSASASPGWACPEQKTFSAGQWKAAKGLLRQTDGRMPARVIFGLPAGWQDYSVKVRLRIDRGNAGGLIFNARDGLNYHVVYINTDSGNMELWEHEGPDEAGRKSLLTTQAAGAVLRKYGWNELEARICGNEASFYINGIAQGQAAIEPVAEPGTGLWTGASEVAYKDLRAARR